MVCGSRITRAIVTAPRSSNPDQILKSLHWLKLQERIEYKVISITYKLLQSSSPRYLRDLITVQPSQSTRSSTLVTLLQPSVNSSLKITNRSFHYVTPHVWNKLPPALRVPYQFDPLSSPSSFSSSCSDPRLKTFLFLKVFPSIAVYLFLGLISWNYEHSLFGSHWRW